MTAPPHRTRRQTRPLPLPLLPLPRTWRRQGGRPHRPAPRSRNLACRTRSQAPRHTMGAKQPRMPVRVSILKRPVRVCTLLSCKYASSPSSGYPSAPPTAARITPGVCAMTVGSVDRNRHLHALWMQHASDLQHRTCMKHVAQAVPPPSGKILHYTKSCIEH